MGTCELDFEGCVEVRHVEKYNPDKADGILGGWEKEMHKYESLDMFGKLQNV